MTTIILAALSAKGEAISPASASLLWTAELETFLTSSDLMFRDSNWWIQVRLVFHFGGCRGTLVLLWKHPSENRCREKFGAGASHRYGLAQ